MLTAIERRGTFLVLVLAPGYVHKAGSDPSGHGTGWHETVHITVPGGEAHGDLSSLPEELSSGSLQCGEAPYLGLVPVPFQFTGPVSLQLTGLSGHSLVVVGRAVSIALVGTGSYVEELPWPVPNSTPGPS
jgi:hypothetical protein